jgi:hypothetical protein
MRTFSVRRLIRFLLGSGLLFLPGVAGAAPLFPNPVYPTGSGPVAVATADFNGDGIPDLITPNEGVNLYDGGPGECSLLLGHGDGTFANEVRIATSEHPTGLVTADLNGDGNADIVLSYDETGDVGVMLGRGNGTFQPETSVATGVWSIRKAKVNDDAIPDLIAEMETLDGGMQAFIGNGDGTFTPGPAYGTGMMAAVEAGDLDGDGYDDAVGIHYFSFNDWEIMRFFGVGDGTFTQAPAILHHTAQFAVLVVADLDGDGNADIGVQSQDASGQPFAISFSAADRTVAPGPVYQDLDLFSVIASDRTGDGLRDFVVIGTYSVTPFVATAARAWQALPYFNSSSGVRPGVLAGFDGDGHDDLAVAGEDAVFVYAGNADGSFGPPVDQTLWNAAFGGVATVDLDGDGNLDIAATVLMDDQVAIRLGHGDGTFGTEARFAAGIGPIFLKTVDLNHDGRLDLVVATRNWHDVYPDPVPPGDLVVLLGNGDGTFQPATSFSEPTLFPFAPMAVKDMDEDGNPDVVIPNAGDGNTEPDLLVVHGNPDGSLGTGTHVSVGAENLYPYGWTGPFSVSTGDFDHDGHVDLVVAMSGLLGGNSGMDVLVPGAVRVLQGLGDGTFAAPATLATGVSMASVFAADLDGDGFEDIAVADDGAYEAPAHRGGVFTLHNDGGGGFVASPQMYAGDNPFDIQVTDLTGDDVLDLVASNNAGYVAIFPGTGNGTFGAPINFGSFGVPLALLNGDYNGDGQRDLMALTTSGLIVLRNQESKPQALQIAAQISFSSPAGKGSGLVNWTTNAENDLIGFNVVQITSSGRQQINTALIPCEECSSGRGASYATIVPKHKSGKSLYIEAVHADHSVETFGPAVKQ